MLITHHRWLVVRQGSFVLYRKAPKKDKNKVLAYFLFLSNCCNYYRFVTYAIKRGVFLRMWIDVKQTLSKNEAEEASNLWLNHLCAREYKASENSSVAESFCPIRGEWTMKHPGAGLMHRGCITGACHGCSNSELPVVTYWKWFAVFIRWWN